MSADAINRMSIFDVQAGNLELHVQSLHAWRTYAGLLEGLPTAELNDHIIGSAVERAKTLAGAPAVTIPPEIVETPSPVRRPGPTYPRLPAFTCVAEIWCWETREADALGSALTVVWFANDVRGGELERTLALAVRDLDWWRHAVDFDI